MSTIVNRVIEKNPVSTAAIIVGTTNVTAIIVAAAEVVTAVVITASAISSLSQFLPLP